MISLVRLFTKLTSHVTRIGNQAVLNMAEVSEQDPTKAKLLDKRNDRPHRNFGWIGMSFPIISSKWYDGGVFAFEVSNRCLEWERDYYKCASKCNKKNANEICWKELEDYMECMTRRKQTQRRTAMDTERKKQNLDQSDPYPKHLIDPECMIDPTDPQR